MKRLNDRLRGHDDETIGERLVKTNTAATYRYEACEKPRRSAHSVAGALSPATAVPTI